MRPEYVRPLLERGRKRGRDLATVNEALRALAPILRRRQESV